MTNFYDEFVGTAGTLLSAHTSDSGHAWTVPPAGTYWTIGPSGEAYSAVGFTTRCSPTVAPASADYTVRAKFKRVTDIAGVNAGIYLRGDISSSTQHGYFFRYVRSTNLWRVDRINAGTTSTLGSGSAASITDGVTYQMELSAIGSTITAKIDGATVWSGVNTDIVAAGIGGITAGGGAASATTGVHLLDFESSDGGSAPTPVAETGVRYMVDLRGSTDPEGTPTYACTDDDGLDVDEPVDGLFLVTQDAASHVLTFTVTEGGDVVDYEPTIPPAGSGGDTLRWRYFDGTTLE